MSKGDRHRLTNNGTKSVGIRLALGWAAHNGASEAQGPELTCGEHRLLLRDQYPEQKPLPCPVNGEKLGWGGSAGEEAGSQAVCLALRCCFLQLRGTHGPGLTLALWAPRPQRRPDPGVPAVGPLPSLTLGGLRRCRGSARCCASPSLPAAASFLLFLPGRARGCGAPRQGGVTWKRRKWVSWGLAGLWEQACRGGAKGFTAGPGTPRICPERSSQGICGSSWQLG